MARLTFAGRSTLDEHRFGIIAKNSLIGKMGADTTRTICRNLKAAVEHSETYSFYHRDLLGILLSVQPLAVLEGLCDGDATSLELGIGILNDCSRWSAFDVLPEEELIAWCEEEPEIRYPGVAGVVTSFRPIPETKESQWTSIGRRLLEKAPNRIAVLRKFTDRFIPRVWKEPRAAAIEANARLLDNLPVADPTVAEFVASEKARLAAAVNSARAMEPFPFPSPRLETSFE
jgi:hypothetical protein